MMPSKYQQKPDGPWYTWTGGHVDAETLAMRARQGEKTCFLNGCEVRAIRFENGRIWTPAEGWQRASD